MRRLIAATAIVIGGLGVAACDTTNPETACRRVDANIEGFSLFNFSEPADNSGAVCWLRSNTTFETRVYCYHYATHDQFRCSPEDVAETIKV